MQWKKHILFYLVIFLFRGPERMPTETVIRAQMEKFKAVRFE